jgi:hypothetical protein
LHRKHHRLTEQLYLILIIKEYHVVQSADINITLSAAAGQLHGDNITVEIEPDNTHALTIDASAFCVIGAFDRSQIICGSFKNLTSGAPIAHILNIPRKQVDYTRSFVTSNNANNVITLNNGDGLL